MLMGKNRRSKEDYARVGGVMKVKIAQTLETETRTLLSNQGTLVQTSFEMMMMIRQVYGRWW